MALLPWIDPEGFNPGYLMRGLEYFLAETGGKERVEPHPGLLDG